MSENTISEGEIAMRAWIFGLAVGAGLLAAGSSYAFPPFQGGSFIDSSGATCAYEVNTFNGVQTTFMWCDDGAQYSSWSRVAE